MSPQKLKERIVGAFQAPIQRHKINVQIREIEKAVEDHDWDAVVKMAINTEYEMVGRYAVDVAAEAGQWKAVKIIGIEGKEPVAKYAVDVAAEAGQWDVVGDIAHNRSEQDSVQKYAEELLKRHKQE
jgi:hypothetical protein